MCWAILQQCHAFVLENKFQKVGFAFLFVVSDGVISPWDNRHDSYGSIG